ncbi:MAG TPA: amino acid adenylation domain-containing protein [Candidatus Sulfotelmatobacter sp.]|nr:amino acid adenylation domain-containing protein [Candidatus Sulfotelmatobacter sp.]
MRNDLLTASQIPLSAAQQRLWVLEQLHPGKGLGNIGIGTHWKGALDSVALEAALNEVLRRHEILGYEFRVINGMPLQVLSAAARVVLARLELEHLGEADRASRVTQIIAQEIAKPFDLEHGPALRATHLVSKSEHTVLLIVHRMVCDGASLRILMDEVAAVYDALVDGQQPARAEVIQYRDLASLSLAADDIYYWKERLSGAPSSLDLPTDHARPATQSFRGASQVMRVPGSLVQPLRELSRQCDVTLCITLVAVFKVLLAHYTRQEDLVIGMGLPGRMRPENRGVVGPLENMVALRTEVPRDLSFAEFLKRVRDVVDGAFAHQGIPFEAVLAELRLDRDLSRHPLFQVRLDMRESDSAARPGMTVFEIRSPAEPFDLRVEFQETEGELAGRFSYSTDLFDAATIARVMEHFCKLLESAATDPNAAISSLPMLSEAERHRLLVEWNDTRVEYPRDIPLHQLIEAQVEKTPDALALVYESEGLSYRQLNSRANQLAHYLQKNGVGPDVLVGVCAERSTQLVIGLLASMKAGGAYVPLDPEYPKDRLETMLADSNPPVVLTQSHLLDRLPAGAKKVFCLDRDWSSLQNESTENPAAAIGGKNLAYAIYTSGSTGKPKGVPNVHEGIVNRLLWMQQMYQLTGRDRVLQKTPFSFDVSVWEFFWPLLAGATLVVARPGGHRDPAYLVSIIAEQGITTLHFVPSMLSIFLEAAGLEGCASVRQVFASGEALPFELQQRFFERMDAELHNLYGPTEAAIDVTYWQCRREGDRSVVPIGRPVANTQIYVLDPNLEPTPIGVPGELHIGGIQLAPGYLNRPELTSEKFIRNPFSQEPGARLYKTGDLARFLPDGNIEYFGRTDFQVKLRGLRIELGEIEVVLGRCQGVLQAVVVVREDRPGDKRLVAYLIAAPGHKLGTDSLRRELRDRLPDYMVPSRFVVVQEFPMTTSGKVDRKALPTPPPEQREDATRVAPRNDIESMVASLFAKVLGLPAVGVADNFFDLGGHSLLAGRVLAQIHESTGRQIPLSAMFRGATVESLAKLVAFGSEHDRDPVLMKIQHGDSRRLPFFAIVPPGEESLGYAMLARHMGPEQTVYKVQGHSPVTRGKRPYSEQEMHALTDEYAAAMRSVQPHGPYCLGGLCDGTHIAEQIVLKLESEGEEVGLFAIFDTWVLQHSQNRFLWKIFYYGERMREMKRLSLAERLASYKRVAEHKVQNLVGSKPARTDWRQAYWPEDFTPPRFRAPVVLFKRPKQPFYYINDPKMGWAERSEGGVTIHEVEFHHAEILREPHVGVFGKTLAVHLQQLTDSLSDSAIGRDELLVSSVPGQQGE